MACLVLGSLLYMLLVFVDFNVAIGYFQMCLSLVSLRKVVLATAICHFQPSVPVLFIDLFLNMT